MKNFSKKLLSPVKIVILAIAISALASSVLAGSYTEPTCSPPSSNCNSDAPLNVSLAGQTKAGGLTLNTGGASTGLIVMAPASGGGNNIIFRDSNNPNINKWVAYLTGAAGSDLSFWEALGSANRVTFKTGGSVGIGITNPNAKLSLGNDVTTIKVAVYENGGSNFYGMGVNGGQLTFGASLVSTTSPPQMVLTAGGNVGIGTLVPGYMLDVNGNVRAGAFYYSSDKNLKQNITPLQGSLDKILALQGVGFNWKDTGKPGVGLIAQDVEKVYPELVSTDSKTGLKSLQYGNLVAPLIEAVKAQQKEIDQLTVKNQQKEIDQLIARIKALEDKIEKNGN